MSQQFASLALFRYIYCNLWFYLRSSITFARKAFLNRNFAANLLSQATLSPAFSSFSLYRPHTFEIEGINWETVCSLNTNNNISFATALKSLIKSQFYFIFYSEKSFLYINGARSDPFFFFSSNFDDPIRDIIPIEDLFWAHKFVTASNLEFKKLEMRI